jgi:transposase
MKQQIISSDAMATGEKYMARRSSRSLIGEPAFLPQFKIGVRTFSLIASVSYLGILCWKIYEDRNVNADDVQIYLKETLEPFIENHHFGIFDNAKVQKTDICVIEMERIFNGNYAFLSPYSPDFNPIERVFSLIRRYLRSNEQYAVLHPVEALNAACRKYSVSGPDGHVCGEFFNLYESNYDLAHI